MCILVVEDDFLIRTILVDELTDAGYAVEEAETGDRAWELLAASEPRFWLLVTDIHLPGSLDGVGRAAAARAQRPELPVIFTTGRPDALQRVRHLGEQQFLIRKPYVPADVLAQVASLRPSGVAGARHE